MFVEWQSDDCPRFNVRDENRRVTMATRTTACNAISDTETTRSPEAPLSTTHVIKHRPRVRDVWPNSNSGLPAANRVDTSRPCRYLNYVVVNAIFRREVYRSRGPTLLFRNALSPGMRLRAIKKQLKR